jgi:sec-independent protein translocase protein TatA
MSLVHWLIVGIIVLLLFGKGRFSAMMGDVAKGLKSFKKGMAEDDELPVAPRRIEGDRTVDPAPAERSRSADPIERHEP